MFGPQFKQTNVCVEGHFWRQSGKFEYRLGIRSYLKIMLISRYEHGFLDISRYEHGFVDM